MRTLLFVLAFFSVSAFANDDQESLRVAKEAEIAAARLAVPVFSFYEFIVG